MDVDKDALRKQFAADWQKHYKLKALIERGFMRQTCPKCSRAFWAMEKRDLCARSESARCFDDAVEDSLLIGVTQ